MYALFNFSRVKMLDPLEQMVGRLSKYASRESKISNFHFKPKMKIQKIWANLFLRVFELLQLTYIATFSSIFKKNWRRLNQASWSSNQFFVLNSETEHFSYNYQFQKVFFYFTVTRRKVTLPI